MSTQITHHDDRIVGSFDDGRELLRRAPTLGTFVGIVVAALLVVLGGAAALWLAPAVVLAATAAGHDLRSGDLPDPLVATATGSGLVGAIAIDGSGVVPFAVGVAVIATPLLAFHLVSPCSMAFGDVKFAAALGGLVGVVGIDGGDRAFLVMAALTVATGVAAFGAVVAGRRQVAFGPSLFLGTAAVLVFAVATRSPFA